MAEPHLFVIYGGTGDLAKRKLFPSLYRMLAKTGVSGEAVVLGVASAPLSDDEYRRSARESLASAGIGDTSAWCDERVYYEQVERGTPSLEPLARRIAAIERDHGLSGNRVFYLALPPGAFPRVIEDLSKVGLNRSDGWTRLVIEKPFGRDLQSAQELNRLVHRYFDENQVYRIDHYLGKELSLIHI